MQEMLIKKAASLSIVRQFPDFLWWSCACFWVFLDNPNWVTIVCSSSDSSESIFVHSCSLSHSSYQEQHITSYASDLDLPRSHFKVPLRMPHQLDGGRRRIESPKSHYSLEPTSFFILHLAVTVKLLIGFPFPITPSRLRST